MSNITPVRQTRTAPMTSPKQRRWSREYLPGYTGFVPTKNNLFGKTSGSINREICMTGGNPDELDVLELTRHKEQTSDLPARKKINPDVYGNHSKRSVNWVCGPTHEIRQQHIPGYTGQCRGFVNKDFMSKSYAKVTAELFSRNHPLGDDTDSANRFTATQRAAYKPGNFRRWVNEPTMMPQKDYDDYSKYVNDNHHEKKQNLLSQTQRIQMHSARREGAQSVLLTPSSTGHGFSRFQNAKRASSIDPGSKTVIKPKVLESKVANKDSFFNLSDGFQKVFSNDTSDQKMVVPVVGYGGHRRGESSQNFFGKSFKETTIQSKFLERQFRQKNSDF